MNNEINISSLNIGYVNSTVLENINITTSSSKLICLIGRNGQGKSTFLKTISGLLPPLKGSIKFNNKDISSYSEKERAKLLSVVLTTKIDIGNITVEEFIHFGRYPYTNWFGINSKSDQTEIENAIQFCGLNEFKNRKYAELSDGEKQKVNIARAIAQNTPIIVLDEPTAHLDLVNKIEILKLLKELVDKQKKMILISTHQIELALQLCDELWVLNNSRIEVGTSDSIIESGTLNKIFDDKLLIFNKETKSFEIK
jgi:cobalamin transport system ATP-binding protein